LVQLNNNKRESRVLLSCLKKKTTRSFGPCWRCGIVHYILQVDVLTTGLQLDLCPVLGERGLAVILDGLILFIRGQGDADWLVGVAAFPPVVGLNGNSISPGAN
jgi:hypothetical protein